MIVKDQHRLFKDEAQKTVSNLQKIEVQIAKNEMFLEASQKKLGEKTTETIKKTQETYSLITKLREDLTKSEKLVINEGNILNFMKPAGELEERWLRSESKLQGLEFSIQQAKRAYEEKSIKIEEFLDLMRRLTSKKFLCLYKKQRLEKMQKRQQMSK